jgi:hypothetical protein
MLAAMRPRDVVGRTVRRLPADQLADLVRLDAQIRHRLSRAGNRRMNHVLYIVAFVQYPTAPVTADGTCLARVGSCTTAITSLD